MLDETAADTAVGVLESVVSSGTGKNAATGDFAWGKTGTTDDNGDAWFCGGTEEITACVWVGHRDSVTPMETEFAGAPVDGGTYPALIWHDIVLAYSAIIGSDDEGRRRRQRARSTPTCSGRPDDPGARPRGRARADRGARAAPVEDGARGTGSPARERGRRPRAGGTAHRRSRPLGARAESLVAARSGRERKRLPAAQKRHG